MVRKERRDELEIEAEMDFFLAWCRPGEERRNVAKSLCNGVWLTHACRKQVFSIQLWHILSLNCMCLETLVGGIWIKEGNGNKGS